jgi:hypothetical protein
MGTRLELQSALEGLDALLHVYFQPPVNLQIAYPAIVYSVDQESVNFADNAPYLRVTRYQVTVIDPDPDGTIREKVGSRPMTRFVRAYTTESLYHYIYTMYF